MTFVAWANIGSPTQRCNLSHSLCLEAWIKCWHSDFMHTQAFGWVEQRVSLAPAAALSYSHADYYGLAQISFHCESCKRILVRREIRHLSCTNNDASCCLQCCLFSLFRGTHEIKTLISKTFFFLTEMLFFFILINFHIFKNPIFNRFFESIYIG